MYYVILHNEDTVSHFKHKTLMTFQPDNEISHNIILKK